MKLVSVLTRKPMQIQMKFSIGSLKKTDADSIIFIAVFLQKPLLICSL